MGSDLESNLRLILDSRDQLWAGTQTTLEMSGIVILSGTLVGLLIGLILLYAPPPLRLPARLYVDVIRGLPGLVTVFIIYYGLPAVGINVASFLAAAIALTAFAGAQNAEIVRGGISSIAKTQVDAGKALGLTFRQRLRYVLLPLAIPRMIPPWINSCVDVVKGTSLLALVSVTDLLLAAQQLLGRTYIAIPFYLAAAAIYIVVNLSITAAGALLMSRFTYLRYMR